MSDERKNTGDANDPDPATGGGAEAGGSASDGGAGGSSQRRRSVGEGIKEGLGVLSAFKDALEETIQEARDRGDLSAERAKSVMKETLEKAQTAAEGAKDKLDFATHADLEEVRATLDSMKARLGDLEESVFGASRAPDDADGGDSTTGDDGADEAEASEGRDAG